MLSDREGSVKRAAPSGPGGQRKPMKLTGQDTLSEQYKASLVFNNGLRQRFVHQALLTCMIFLIFDLFLLIFFVVK
jgi:hypothetical protein